MEGGYMSEQEYEKILCEMKEELVGMKDLFVRRLYEDKQKTELIRILTEQIHFTVLEPFISDLILVLDRLESSEDEFSCSVHDEIYDILHRRGVEEIDTRKEFDPSVIKIVCVEEKNGVDKMEIEKVIRKGYRTVGKVLRSAEVAVLVPAREIDSSKQEKL